MRGDLVTIAMQGDFGKPRPALAIQANQFSEHTSVTVLPVTSTLVAASLLRITVQPNLLERDCKIGDHVRSENADGVEKHHWQARRHHYQIGESGQ
ncbi:type II toxin-antitoxin system PemK/MazF family toxin [Thauera sp. Sel9]|uniref:type II toxin-antitoxin system PemK/MazF family toxin n=1 Tax=Thauera sp. Sel9 TaxID=2974299 RepID=UPI0021E19EF2|nr:type II toxin-antitoxin system PemK/MazF family toxin [Thauera sp. Sel9]MCV2219030.1 type II toxin-antitoxin system PemK/MazF family toxin [Thauera sp. Sel9]